MRKILAILLVLIMMISAIPLTLVHAAEVTAPTTLSDETEIVLTSITDGTMTKKDGVHGSAWTKGMTSNYNIFDGRAFDLSKCSGLLFKVTQTGENQLYLRFFLNFGGENTSIEVKANGRVLYLYDGSGWSSLAGDTTNWSLGDWGKDVSKYIYLPFDILATELKTYGNIVSDIRLYSSRTADVDGRAGVFSELSFVQTKEHAKQYPLIPSPTMFPETTTTMLYKQVTDGTFTNPADSVQPSVWATKFEGTTTHIFKGGAVDLNNVKGLLFKFKNVKSSAPIQWYFQFKMATGDTISVKPAERDYFYYDGSKWKEQDMAGKKSYWYTPSIGEGYIYFELPFSELTTTEITNIKLTSAGTTTRAGSISELSLVYSPEQVITNANVSLTDDLAWNVYANIPDGCTDSKVTFSINGNEDVAEYSNGRYTLKDILPQQIGFDITATWTGTVNGATITDTVTSSIEDYCRAIIADEAQTDWHELTKALLHYGAAAQVRTGYTGALCNDGIAAVTNPVDLTALDPTLANNDTSVWSGATLRLDDSLALKITLEAPQGVTSVTATVEGRDGSTTLDIIDGCVVLPLNAYELSKTVTFSYGNAEKDLVISADYVLKNTTNAAYTDLAQAVADYSREAEIIKNQ